MDDQPLERAARIIDLKDAHRTGDLAMVANLPAAFRVERRGVEDHQRRLRRADLAYLNTIHHQPHDFPGAADALVAGELGRADALEDVGQRGLVFALREGGAGAAALLLLLHGM